MLYSFYRKPTASPYVLMESSALGWINKLSTLAQDLIWRIMHVSLEMDWAERIRIVNEYVMMLGDKQGKS